MMLKSVVALSSQTPKSATTLLARPAMRTSELERLEGEFCGAGAGVGSMGLETKCSSRNSSTSGSPGGSHLKICAAVCAVTLHLSPFPPRGEGECSGRRGSSLVTRLPRHPGPLPLRGGEGVRWRCWFRAGKHLIVGRLAPPTARTNGRQFPLSPSDGERAGVRGQAVRLA